MRCLLKICAVWEPVCAGIGLTETWFDIYDAL